MTEAPSHMDMPAILDEFGIGGGAPTEAHRYDFDPERVNTAAFEWSVVSGAWYLMLAALLFAFWSETIRPGTFHEHTRGHGP